MTECRIFDGVEFARRWETSLLPRVAACGAAARQQQFLSITFTEDTTGQLYAKLKAETASRLGLVFQGVEHSLKESVEQLVQQLQLWAAKPQVAGYMVQKPTRALWQQIGQLPADYDAWWQKLTTAISPQKDLDGLNPQSGRYSATARAVEAILDSEKLLNADARVAIIGRSDLLGLPLEKLLRQRGVAVQLLGRRELVEQGIAQATVVVSATGTPNLITGVMLRPGAAVIDVGEPQPDIELASVCQVASFLTPVPGGVGPVTVIALWDGALALLGVI